MSRGTERSSARYVSAEAVELSELADTWALAIAAVDDPNWAHWLAAALQPYILDAFAEEAVH